MWLDSASLYAALPSGATPRPGGQEEHSMAPSEYVQVCKRRAVRARCERCRTRARCFC